MDSLDYEQTPNYTLVLTATDMHSGITSDKKFHIHVIDQNDEVPKFAVDFFTGTMEEELSPDDFLRK
jgi:hypothetical protein